MKKYFNYFMWFLFFSFLIFGMWEFLQTPFFDDKTNDLNIIVYNRVHCTIGDILILFFSIIAASLILKSIKWIFNPVVKQYFIVSGIGIFYTVYSEINNVYLVGGWAYSDFMPKVYGVGLMPLLQWLLLPSLILYVTGTFVKSLNMKNKSTIN